MKKAIIAIAALFVAVSAHAQFGVVAGLTSSSSNIEAAFAEVVAEAALRYDPGLSRQGLVPQPYQPAHRLPSLFFYVSVNRHVKKVLRLLIILFNFVSCNNTHQL